MSLKHRGLYARRNEFRPQIYTGPKVRVICTLLGTSDGSDDVSKLVPPP